MASKPINIPDGLEPVLNHTEKPFRASYYRQFSTDNKMKTYRITTSFVRLEGPYIFQYPRNAVYNTI